MSRDNDSKDYHDEGICDFCGRRKCDPSLMFQMHWHFGKTCDFCDLDCLQKYKKAWAIDEDAVLDGPPGTAKRVLEEHEQKEKQDKQDKGTTI